MAHEISVNSITGKEEAYYADKPAWHGLGTVVDGARTSEEVINLAGLNWRVEQKPLFHENLLSDGSVVKTEIDSHQANVRGDTGDLLGVVGKNWKPLQNAAAFEFMDSLVDDGTVKYEAAGALKGGKLVWILARMNPDFDKQVKGDEFHRYAFLYMGHDGLKAINYIPTNTRVVCWNTAEYAEQAARNVLKIQHNAKNLEQRIDMARDTILASHKGLDEMITCYEALTEISDSEANIEKFMQAWLPVVEVPVDATELLIEEARKKNLRTENLREKIIETYVTDETCRTKAAVGNMYGVYNAVTRYYDHTKRSASRETRFENAMIGYNAKKKRDALEAMKTEFLAVG